MAAISSALTCVILSNCNSQNWYNQYFKLWKDLSSDKVNLPDKTSEYYDYDDFDYFYHRYIRYYYPQFGSSLLNFNYHGHLSR